MAPIIDKMVSFGNPLFNGAGRPPCLDFPPRLGYDPSDFLTFSPSLFSAMAKGVYASI
jgi:hypothetical protein